MDWAGRARTPRIAALVKFRREHAAELATDPAVAAHVTSEIAAIEELRRAAGVSGQSTQRVYVDSRRTLYSRIGDIFPGPLLFSRVPVFSRRFADNAACVPPAVVKSR